MLSEGELKQALFAVIQEIQNDLFPLARAVFREEKVIEAIKAGDTAALIVGLKYGLARWVPSREKLMVLIASGVLGEAALIEYEILKSNLRLEEKNDPNSEG